MNLWKHRGKKYNFSNVIWIVSMAFTSKMMNFAISQSYRIEDSIHRDKEFFIHPIRMDAIKLEARSLAMPPIKIHVPISF